MRVAALLASSFILLTVSGCEPPASNLQTSPLTMPNESICPKDWKLTQVGPGAYECEPQNKPVPPAPME